MIAVLAQRFYILLLGRYEKFGEIFNELYTSPCCSFFQFHGKVNQPNTHTWMSFVFENYRVFFFTSFISFYRIRCTVQFSFAYFASKQQTPEWHRLILYSYSSADKIRAYIIYVRWMSENRVQTLCLRICCIMSINSEINLVISI